jgi:3-dehydroquinate synthase
MTAEMYLEHMAVDKKNLEGAIRLILLEHIGKASLPMSVDLNLLRATLDHYGRA